MGLTTAGLSHWQGEPAEIPLLNMTIGDLLDHRAEELPSSEAVVYSGYPEYGGALDLRWTYRDLREHAEAVARGLLALGLHKGEHIAVWAANLPEWLLLEMAAAKAGLVLVTVNPVLRARELEYVLRQGDVAALFFMARIRDHDCLETVRRLATPAGPPGVVRSETLPCLRYVCLIGPLPEALAQQRDWRPALFRELVAAGTAIPLEALRERQRSLSPDDVVQIQYTSGTTGFPKGAMLTHRNVLNNAMLFVRRSNGTPADRVCNPMPFFHTAGCVLAVLGCLYMGTTLVPMLAFDPLKTLQIVSRERCTLLGAVPTMLLALLQHPDFDRYDLSTLRAVTSGGAPVPLTLMQQVKEQIGADITIVYGLTESSPVITQTLPDDSFELKASTVGVPLPYTDVKIVDPASGAVVPCGTAGELCCRGYLVMKGYYKMPEKTAEAIDSDGWLHTGDLATMDEQGYVRIVGRLKEMIIRGGENIYPAEIEDFLLQYPGVAEAQVIGVPDPFFGEEIAAVIRPREGAQLSAEELRAFCQGQISHQKIPRYFLFTNNFPMTASGKVQKFLLREQAVKELGLQEARP
ncbi:AMP-binding protein [Thermogemmatispora onikobensis]|uniref:AMP-binding protein n=1 Tax=Thermogemmatispora onikobensis TaxID=732234 RepID=UPI0008538949|nr:AMP-binding protein [Thermogemmatispora onikobensis]